ncbi:TPA: ANL family adenylate-forming protein [Bacillus cereus]
MDKIFLVYNDIEYTYKKLIEDLNAKESYYSYLYINENNPYEIFLSIIHSLLYNYSIEILDGDFSKKELEEINVETKKIFSLSKVKKQQEINTFETLLREIIKNEKWTLTLYTSGTTGRPKKVSHTLTTLIRNVKLHEKFKENTWSFAYNPTHMAGLQVFFQALLNQNTLIYTFNEQAQKFPDLIETYNITNISATPTFYRNVFPYLKNKMYLSVKRITFGGEKYDPSLEKTITSIFPSSEIRNIYASTEAGSLFVAKGDIFEIPRSIRGLVKINQNELLIHSDLLGTSESFSLTNNWFHTGDLVEQINQYRFKIISRQSEMINVGGYKVNPIEVENILIKVPGINDVLVKGKENKVTGKILIVDVVKDNSFVSEEELTKSIKQFATENLQKWKVPRIIQFVNEIPKTRTGKKVRN